MNKSLIAPLLSLALAFAGASSTGCASMAVWTAPEKKPEPDHSVKAKAANAEFWTALHGGRYESIPQVLDRLQAVYLENPRDPDTTAHIGFAHTWRIAEAARLENPSPAVTDHIVVARKYFQEAVRLSPKDARFAGFLASLELAEGTVHADEKLVRRGYFDLLAAKDAWPEFNMFTAGYSLSTLPHTNPMFAEGLDYQWENLDVCVGEKIDRKTADFAKYMAMEVRQGPKRVCWNSWIAPHNLEGFFLNLGDMLVKQGDTGTARRVYAQAKVSKTYGAWAYKQVLEDRIRQADDNVEPFRHPARGEKIRTPMAKSAFACMGCHEGEG